MSKYIIVKPNSFKILITRSSIINSKNYKLDLDTSSIKITKINNSNLILEF